MEDEEEEQYEIEEPAPVNPEGYGIEGDFQPLAVFETEDDNLFGADPDQSMASSALESTKAADGEETLAGEDETEEGEKSSEGEEEELGEQEQSEELEKGEEGDEVGDEAEGEEASKTSEEEQVEGEEADEGKEEEEEEKGEEEGEATEGEEGKKRPKPVEVHPQAKKKPKRRKSITYPAISRFRGTEETRVSGDFQAVKEETLAGEGESPPSIESYHFEQRVARYVYGEGEEEEEEVEEEEEIPVDRELYYSRYKEIIPERNLRKMKNNFLHRKLADYFKKRKMEYVLKETEMSDDALHKYYKKLDALAELRELDLRERNSITVDLNDLRTQRDEQRTLVDSSFINMQNREKEIGTGLINTKTGKQIPDKLVERLLNRQKTKWTEVSKMRLAYIKLRNKVTEKKTALHALDCVGDNLHLIDFEQLKIEHQSHTDKIEERDEELTRLRIKCSSAMQCLAHVREKSAAVLLDMIKLKEREEDVESDFMDCRERLNYFKQERDSYRAEKRRLYAEAGLLTNPILLRDMESAIEEVRIESEKLEKLKDENKRLKNSLFAIKKNISSANLRSQTFKRAPVKSIIKTKRVYKGRPTLVYPELPRSEWSDFD